MIPRISILVASDSVGGPEITRTLASIQRQDVPCEVIVASPEQHHGPGEPAPTRHAPAGHRTAGARTERHLEVDTSAVDPADLVATLLGAALDAARGARCTVVGPGDELEPGALAACLGLFASAPSTDVLYTDEQWPGESSTGIFSKPRWSPHYLESYPYLGRLLVVRTELLRTAGGFRAGFTGAEEWDVALRVTELADVVAHLPFTALTRLAPPPADPSVAASGVRAVEAHLSRIGAVATAEPADPAPGVRVWRAIADAPSVTIVIPTAGAEAEVDGAPRRLILSCLASILASTTYPHWDVVVVTGPNTPPEVQDEVTALLGDRVRFTHVEGAFNFSRSINEGARLARGELVLLLNDDTEVLEPRWLERLVSVLQDPTVGAVGAKLVLADGRIQHVGVVMGEHLVPGHAYALEVDADDRFGAKTLDRDYIAVTGACLLTRRDLFERVGGLSEALPLNFNDVDLCLKLGATGFGVVCTPFATLAHHESSTRRPVLLPEDQAFLERHWGLRLAADPHIGFRSDR